MRAGQTFLGALAAVVDMRPSPRSANCAERSQTRQLGVPIARGARTVAERMKSGDFQHVAMIATLQRETGGNTAEVMELVAETIRERLEIRQMVRALTAQGRLAGFMLSGPARRPVDDRLADQPGIQHPLFHTTIGLIALGAGVADVARAASSSTRSSHRDLRSTTPCTCSSSSVRCCIGVSVASILAGVLGTRRFRTAERLVVDPRLRLHRRAAASTTYLHDRAAHNAALSRSRPARRLLGRRFGASARTSCASELMSAGMYSTSPRTLLGYRVSARCCCRSLSFLLVGLRQAAQTPDHRDGPFAGWVLPLTIVRRKARKRLEEIDRRLPDLIDLLCVMVEAGLGFSPRCAWPRAVPAAARRRAAADAAGADDGPGHRRGAREPRRACRHACRCARSCGRWRHGERMGISTGQIMRNLVARDALRRRRSQAEERAQKAPIVMLFPLVF